jgi:hypothetical protein
MAGHLRMAPYSSQAAAGSEHCRAWHTTAQPPCAVESKQLPWNSSSLPAASATCCTPAGHGRWQHADGSSFEGLLRAGERISGKFVSADGSVHYEGG